uniref:CCHC-type domain-containing protein n=1 Tax=Meloidogyne javanica TaxID=6303 RepID=A0A915MLH4_MELJA
MNSASWNGVPLWNCVTEAAAGANEQLYNFDSLAEVIKRYGNPKQRPPGPGCNRCGANHKTSECPSGGTGHRIDGSTVIVGRSIRCFSCGVQTSTHTSETCPRTHPNARGPSTHNKCWNCGHMGHKANKCPRPRYAAGEAANTRTRQD